MRTRKQQLLDALTAYLVRHGIADLSLRPMAAAAGSSARLLIFHFGSKEKLLGEVLHAMQARLQASFTALVESRPKGPLLRAFWDWALQKPNFEQLRLLYQLQVLAAQSPRTYGRYLRRNSLNWLELILAALPEEQRDPAFATLLGAVFDGLFIEVMSTGERRRATDSLDFFIALARAGLPAARRSR